VQIGYCRLLGRTAGAAAPPIEHVNDVVAQSVQLRLREVGKQVLVAAMAVDDDDFLAAVACHLVGGFLQQLQLNLAAIRDGARLVFGFEDLAEVILGEDHGVFLRGGFERGVAHVEQVGAKREMRSVLFENAEGEQARSLRALNGGRKVGGGEFLPFGGHLRLRAGVCGREQKPSYGAEEKEQSGHSKKAVAHGWHDSSGVSFAIVVELAPIWSGK